MDRIPITLDVIGSAFTWKEAYDYLQQQIPFHGKKDPEIIAIADEEYSATNPIIENIWDWYMDFNELKEANDKLSKWISELKNSEDKDMVVVGLAFERVQPELEWNYARNLSHEN